MIYKSEDGMIEFRVSETGRILFRPAIRTEPGTLLEVYATVERAFSGGHWAPVPDFMMKRVPQEVLDAASKEE